MALSRPFAHGLAIRGIAEDPMRAPRLLQAVLSSREVSSALGISGGRARIERKLEFLVEIFEEGCGSRPLFRSAAVERFVNRHAVDVLC